MFLYSSKLIAWVSFRYSLQSSPRTRRIGTRDTSCCWKRHVTNVLADAQPSVNHRGSQSHGERSRWVIATFGFAPANRDFARSLETLGLPFPAKYYKLMRDTALRVATNDRVANGTKISSVAIRQIIKDDDLFVTKESKFHREETVLLSDDFRLFYIIKKFCCYNIIVDIRTCCLAFRDFNHWEQNFH